MHRALWLVLGLAVGLLTGLQVGRALAPAPDVASAGSEVATQAPVSAVASSPTRAPVARTAAPAAAAAIPPSRQLPPARRDLRLLGTITGRPEERIALIEKAASGAQDIYSLGDTIQAGVRLVRIEANSVVLDRRGRLEVLHLTGSELPGEATAGSGRTGADVPTPGPYRVYNEMSHVGPAADAHAARPRKTSLDEHLRLVPATFQREHGMTLATALLSAAVGPRVINGMPAGLTLRDLGSGGVLTSLGFHEGDVLLSATGVPLDRPSDLAILAEDFEGGRRMWVRIERGGAPRYLLYEFT